MKKYKLIAVLAASMAFTTGCYDLDVFPEDQLNSTTFFQTQAHADQAMMGVYSLMTDEDVFGRQFGFDCLGGVGSGYDPASYATIARGTYTSSEGFVTNKFQKLYEGISRANIVLQNVDKCDMTEELKERYKAEAKFMRALYYFTLMDFWGGVPIYDETTIVEDEFMSMLKPKSDIETVRQFILTDLEEGIKKLPVEWDSTNKGRATSGAALALKGKVLLYAKAYAEAAAEFEKVIKGGNHELYPDYAGLFRPNEGDESSEMIFAIQNIGGRTSEYGMPLSWFLGNQSSYNSGWNNMMVSNNLVDSYEWNDGRPFDWDEVIPGYNESLDIREQTYRVTLTDDNSSVEIYPETRDVLLSMYDQRDPRMQATVILPFTIYKGWDGAAGKDCEYVMTENMAGLVNTNGFVRPCNSYENYLFRKFTSEYDFGGLITDRANTPINFPLIRYADVLLMLAECYNEMGNIDQAVALINQVRARVNMPGINSGPTWLEARNKEAVFERIKHERAVELVGEGLRYSDLRRWGLLETINGKQNLTITGLKYYYTCTIRDSYNLFPIPSNEIYQNPSLEQNPGY